jgi:hypothetical protein
MRYGFPFAFQSTGSGQAPVPSIDCCTLVTSASRSSGWPHKRWACHSSPLKRSSANWSSCCTLVTSAASSPEGLLPLWRGAGGDGLLAGTRRRPAVEDGVPPSLQIPPHAHILTARSPAPYSPTTPGRAHSPTAFSGRKQERKSPVGCQYSEVRYDPDRPDSPWDEYRSVMEDQGCGYY